MRPKGFHVLCFHSLQGSDAKPNAQGSPCEFESHTESALEDLKADSVVWTETDPVFDLICVFAWEYFCNYAKSEQLQRVSSCKKSRKTVQMLEKHTCVL